MNGGSSQLVIHAPKPIRPTITLSSKAQNAQRRRSSASQASGSPVTPGTTQSFGSVLPESPRDAAEELWSIFKCTAGPASINAAATWRSNSRSRASSRNSNGPFHGRVSPRNQATPPPRLFFNPVKFQSSYNVWGAQSENVPESNAVTGSPSFAQAALATSQQLTDPTGQRSNSPHQQEE